MVDGIYIEYAKNEYLKGLGVRNPEEVSKDGLTETDLKNITNIAIVNYSQNRK